MCIAPIPAGCSRSHGRERGDYSKGPAAHDLAADSTNVGQTETRAYVATKTTESYEAELDVSDATMSRAIAGTCDKAGQIID